MILQTLFSGRQTLPRGDRFSLRPRGRSSRRLLYKRRSRFVNCRSRSLSVYHCDGLAARLKVLLTREQELANLMNRASEGGGRVLIGNLASRTDYENAVGEKKVLRRAAAKKCELPPPAQPVSRVRERLARE